jgi:hypothetical protein
MFSEIVHVPDGAISMPPSDPGEAIIRSFRDIYEHNTNTAYACLYRDEDCDKHVPAEPEPEKNAEERVAAADELVDEFEQLKVYFRQAVNQAVFRQITKPVVIRPRYDVPVLFRSLACTEPIAIRSFKTFITGNHLINQFGYLLPVQGVPPRKHLFERQPLPPTWWLRVLDNQTGEPLVRFDFPRLI